MDLVFITNTDSKINDITVVVTLYPNAICEPNASHNNPKVRFAIKKDIPTKR